MAPQAIDGFSDDLEIPLDQLPGSPIGCERVEGHPSRVIDYELRRSVDVPEQTQQVTPHRAIGESR